MENQFLRTELLIGKRAMKKLSECRAAVFGIGGVGGYVCEALVRSGIGAFDLIDHDTVDITNLNRQIIATHESIGKYKVEVMKERMLSINPEVKVRTYADFFLPENAEQFPFSEYDYVIDAIDTITAKIEIILRAQSMGIPVISAMGTGNKMDPTRFRIADIYETRVCPLAKVMRKELKKRGVEKLKVLYSEEEPLRPLAEIPKAPAVLSGNTGEAPVKRLSPASNAFCPSAAGLIIASEVIRDLTSDCFRMES